MSDDDVYVVAPGAGVLLDNEVAKRSGSLVWSGTPTGKICEM